MPISFMSVRKTNILQNAKYTKSDLLAIEQMISLYAHVASGSLHYLMNF